MPTSDVNLWQRLLLLALAGAAGTLARHLLSGLVYRALPVNFPWGVLAVNALGCLLFGLVWGLGESRAVFNGEARLIVLVGFMGAFTTFSTFAFNTGELMIDSRWLAAAGNLLLQNVGGIVLVLAGMAIGRWM